MVRHYKRIKEKSYSERQLERAVDAVKENKMTLSQAAKLFEIPRTTISFRLNHCVMTRAGHPTVFSPEFEKRMADCLHTMEKCGFPLTRKEASV